LAARFVRDEEAAGSNPATPTSSEAGFSSSGTGLSGSVRQARGPAAKFLCRNLPGTAAKISLPGSARWLETDVVLGFVRTGNEAGLPAG
jgi:hypothetical protein